MTDSSDARSELVRKLLEGEGRGEVADSIPTRQDDGPAPVSFGQQQLWFVDRLRDGETPEYVMPILRRFRGPLDVEALQAALNRIVERHDVLRTTFAEDDSGDPVQVVHDHEPLEIEPEDVPGEDDAARIAREACLRPFDLEAGPLQRCRLLRLDRDDHALVLTFHHAIFDGWSRDLFLDELRELYNARVEGRDPDLPDLPIQYDDFAAWQRDALQDGAIDDQVAYWRDKLDGVPVLDLPTDNPRSELPEAQAGDVRFEIPAHVRDALQNLALDEDATMMMVLLAAYKVLLSRYAGQDDVPVGSPTAGRSRSEVEDLLGLFVNVLVLRTDLSGDPTFRETLRRVRETSVEAYDHQEVPFEKLVRELDPDRDLSRDPLFQVLFDFGEGGPETADDLAGLTVEPLPFEIERTNYDLNLHVWTAGDEIHGSLRYRTSLFHEGMVENMTRNLVALVGAVAEDPDRPLSALPVPRQEERDRVLEAWNPDPTADPSGDTIHGRFEAQVAATPDRDAVVFEGSSLTYDELDTRANRIAHLLRDRGVERGTPVGVGLPRGPTLVAALLGILKAGGCYVPLDLDDPSTVRRHVIEETQAPVVLADGETADTVPPGATDAVVRLDGTDLQDRPSHAPAVEVTADDRAYVMYTSGSTGRPKGVESTHRGVVPYLDFLVDEYGLDRDDVVLNLAPIGFDPSVRDLFAPLVVGGRVAMVPEERAQDPRALLDRIARDDVTALLSLVPSVLRAMDQAGSGERPIGSVETVLTCGEALTPADCRTIRSLFGEGVDVVNQYGPTECTMIATYHRIRPADLEASDGRSVPIGEPVPCRRVYVLDGELDPVPVGVPGEIHIGGPGLSEGYVGRPELTEERYVPDPFVDDAEARMYRTGDLARWRADGRLEFLGRTDRQLKIRGQRVEPAGVEAALREHDAVAECTVAPWRDAEGYTTLVGYYVPTRDTDPSSSALRSHLESTLPRAMVPSRFVPIDEIPLRSNGKVDRDALPEPDVQDRPQEDSRPPETETERAVASVWKRVLGLDEVGVHENFFDLGGHSLLAMKVLSQVQRQRDVELPLRIIFQKPTIEQMADEIESRTDRDEDDGTTTIGRSDRSQYRVSAEDLPG